MLIIIVFLSGVIAYVDVRTGSDNRSKSIANEMERMGAVILANFSKKATHVIFKDGSKPVYDKAKSLGIPILSYLWVVQCKEMGQMVQTQDYPAINSQDYDSPFFKWRVSIMRCLVFTFSSVELIINFCYRFNYCRR